LKKPVTIISIILILLVITAIFIVPKIFSKKEQSGPNQKQNPNQLISADGFIITEQLLENEISTIGTIRANEEVEIRSEVSRKILSINFKEGGYVSRGQTLFSLDASDLTARLRKLEIEEKLAISKFEREKTLLEKGLTSQEEYDINENSLEKIRADITITRIDISKTRIRAPFSGIAGLRNVSKGSYVTPQTVLVTLQDVSRVKVDFSIPEKYSPFFKKGQKLTFDIEGIEGTFKAEVYAYEPKVENNTRTLLLRAVCTNPGKKLMPGSFANVKLKLFETDKAILIPTQALIPKLKGQSVLVMRNGRTKLTDVEIGTRTEEYVQLTSGEILLGDTIITTNILRIKDNQPVKVTVK